MNFQRIGEEINVALTEIYGQYVAKGSPTKLGGLRFLDVASAKTFAFEKTMVHPSGEGNLLVLSAPFAGDQQTIEKKLKKGVHSDMLHEVIVRTSKDQGKKGKYFVEAAYTLDTATWLNDKNVEKMMKEHCLPAHEAIKMLINEHVLPVAEKVMELYVQVMRNPED